MADLRNVDPYKKNEEDIIFNMSAPIKEREYDVAVEGLLKGIGKKMMEGLKEKHGVAMILAPIVINVAVVLILLSFGVFLSTVNLLLLSVFTLIAGVIFITSFLQNLNPVKAAKSSYVESLSDPIIIYTSEVENLEKYYQSLYDYDLRTLATLLAEDKVDGYDGEVSKEFLVALDCYIRDCNKLVMRYAKTLHSMSYNVETEKEHIQNDTATGLLDIHLLAFYLGLTKS